MAASTLRDIIEIDEERCDGCALCIPSCAEGALVIIDGKARVVDDARCDGAGACLGHCPQDALKVIKRVASEFDEQYAAHVAPAAPAAPAPEPPKPAPAPKLQISAPGGCPGSRMAAWSAPAAAAALEAQPSALRQWPVQLHLVSPAAPFFEGKELLLAADCVAFAQGDFHSEMLEGRALAIACPKLDDPSGYVEKLAAILSSHDVPAMRVAIMEVPCCGGLASMAVQAARLAAYEGAVEIWVVSRFGQIQQRQLVQPGVPTGPRAVGVR